jgi:hypothetical protein
MEETKKVQRCPKCGKRIRGKNHESGDHHLGRVARKSSRK